MSEWEKRELIGEFELDRLEEGEQLVLKAWRKWWPDGSSCLDIMKYIKTPSGEQCYFPLQHIQIKWGLADPFLKLFQDNKIVSCQICGYEGNKNDVWVHLVEEHDIIPVRPQLVRLTDGYTPPNQEVNA